MDARIAFLPQAGKPDIAWRRAGLVLLSIGGALLWLALLPNLLAQDGMSVAKTGCDGRGYRDPVTGRAAPAPHPPFGLGRSHVCATPFRERAR